MIENYIPMEDVLIRIKYHPDITKEEKEQFKESIKGIYMTEKGKVKMNKPKKYQNESNTISTDYPLDLDNLRND
jgi:hypothetical protein